MNMFGRSQQQLFDGVQHETIFTSNPNSSQLVNNYFFQMSEQVKALKTGKSTKHMKLLSGNILGPNQIPFQLKEETEFQQNNEEQKQYRRQLFERSFFILETSTAEELDTEEDKMSEKTRFFYTYNLDCHPNDQLYFVGTIQAYISFAKMFEPKEEPISIINFLHSQLAMCQFNKNNILVVTAPISVPQNSLENLVHRMINCLSMFHGVSSPLIEDHLQNDQVIISQEKMNAFGLELTTLFDRFNESPVDFFDPLGYIELPPRSNSVFLSAVHLLDELLDDMYYDGKNDVKISRKPFNYLGACVLYDENVLCNQLPESFLKEIVLFRIMCINRLIQKADLNNVPHIAETNSQEQQSGNASPLFRRADWMQPNDSIIRVDENSEDEEIDLSDNEYEKSANGDNHFIFGINERLDICRIYPNKKILELLKSNMKKLQTETIMSYCQQQQQIVTDDGKDLQKEEISFIELETKKSNISVQLFIYKCGNTWFVSVFEILEKPSTVQIVLRNHLRTICSKPLFNIDKTLEKLNMGKNSKQGPLSPHTSPNSPNFESSNRVDSENQAYIVVDRMRVKRVKTSQRRPSLNDNSRIPSVIILNNSDQMMTTNNTHPGFLRHCALIHEGISMHENISTDSEDRSMESIIKLYLKNASHVLYSRKLFDTEIIYHQQIQHLATQNAGKLVEQFKLENLENNIQDFMRREFHINML